MTDIEVTDWLLSKTIDDDHGTAVRCRAVCALLVWLLGGRKGSPSGWCKALGINTTVADIRVASETYKLLLN